MRKEIRQLSELKPELSPDQVVAAIHAELTATQISYSRFNPGTGNLKYPSNPVYPVNYIY